MKYIAVLLAYMALMMNISHYYQLRSEQILLDPWTTTAYVLLPVIGTAIIVFLGIVLVAVGMYFGWWKKPTVKP